MFDNSVKKYRAREDQETAHLVARRTSKLKHSSHPGTPHKLHISLEAVETAKQNAQKELEQLPAEIIRQTQNFHEHMQFYVNHGQVDPTFDQTPQVGEENRLSRVPTELKALLDQIGDLEGMSSKAKRELLQDEDARQVRVLSLICALKRHRRRLSIDIVYAEYRT